MKVEEQGMFGWLNKTAEAGITDVQDALAAGGVVVDVRSAAEYAGGHVPGAVNVPLPELGAQAARLAAQSDGGRVLVVCQSGRRSVMGAKALVKAGATAVSVSGGTAAWQGAGLPVVKGSQPR